MGFQVQAVCQIKYTIVLCASEFDEVEDDNEENISSEDVNDEDYVEK